MAKILQEGFDEYPDLYRPLTVDRNRQWLPHIEQLLDDSEDYLVVVGALHLVGQESVIDLLERKGHKVRTAVGRPLQRILRPRHSRIHAQQASARLLITHGASG